MKTPHTNQILTFRAGLNGTLRAIVKKKKKSRQTDWIRTRTRPLLSGGSSPYATRKRVRHSVLGYLKGSNVTPEDVNASC